MKENLKSMSSKYMYIIFGLYMMTLFMNNTTFFLTSDIVNVIIKIIRYSIYSLFVLNIFLDWKKGDSFTIPMIASLVLAVLVFIFSKNKDIVIFVLTIIALKNCDFDKLVKVALGVFLTMLLLTVDLSLLKVLPDWTYGRGELIRHSLGLYYPTITQGLYLSVILMYCYLRKSDAKLIELLILETINIFLYTYTNGRLSFILCSFILAMMVISKFENIKYITKYAMCKKILKVLCYTFPILMFLLSFSLSVSYSSGNSIVKNIDQVLSGRLKYSNEALKKYEITLFGKDIKWNGWGGHGYVKNNNFNSSEYNYVDISYIRILLDYGIVATILILYAYTAILIKSYNQKKYWLCIIMFYILIWSFIEPYIIYIGKNIFALAFRNIINEGKKIRFLDYNFLKNHKTQKK